MSMKITTNASKQAMFKHVPLGDLFAIPPHNELYVKTLNNRAISIRTGSKYGFSPKAPVKLVKKIHVEFENGD